MKYTVYYVVTNRGNQEGTQSRAPVRYPNTPITVKSYNPLRAY